MSNRHALDDFDRRFARRKVFFLITLLVLVFALGTLGYMMFEGWGALDAFYMTVITLATIGYGEVHPLTTAGRIFTIGLIFAGLGLFTVMIGSVSQAVLDRQFYRLFDRSRKMREQIEKMKNHTIFCI